MAYSFIELPSKTPWTDNVKRVWVVTLFLLVFMMLTAYVLHLLGTGLAGECRQLVREQDTLALQIGQMEVQHSEAEGRKRSFEQIQTANQLLEDKVKDILDLVPDGATLERFELRDGALTVEGYSRNDDAVFSRFVAALSELYRLQKRQIRQEAGGKLRFRLLFGSQEEAP